MGTAATIAGIVERALAQEFFPTPTRLEELEEKDELAFAGDGSLVVPFGVKAPAGSVEWLGSAGVSRGVFALILRVNRNQGHGSVHDF